MRGIAPTPGLVGLKWKGETPIGNPRVGRVKVERRNTDWRQFVYSHSRTEGAWELPHAMHNGIQYNRYPYIHTRDELKLVGTNMYSYIIKQEVNTGDIL